MRLRIPTQRAATHVQDAAQVFSAETETTAEAARAALDQTVQRVDEMCRVIELAVIVVAAVAVAGIVWEATRG